MAALFCALFYCVPCTRACTRTNDMIDIYIFIYYIIYIENKNANISKQRKTKQETINKRKRKEKERDGRMEGWKDGNKEQK